MPKPLPPAGAPPPAGLFDDPPAPAQAPARLGANAHATAGPAASADAPLAERLRPQTLQDVVGQVHLLAPGRPLHRQTWGKRLPSMILWGPPGVGKTTLARLLARASGAHFIVLSAVLAGVREIRDAVEQARSLQAAGKATVLFVDEVHRFNKAQQDAFLPHVESGLFSFIGATTENPSFEVNPALLSRATVHVLQPLAPADLALLLQRGQSALLGPTLSPAAQQRLIGFADGDARRLLNAYEAVAVAHPGAAPVEAAALEQTLGETLRRGDKGGDVFYDTLSALHKSVRGSNPDAALYWLARLLDSGADPRVAARRLVRMASEDIGLADPRALQLTLDAAAAYERLGSPEGELALAQAATYLAVAPKSDAVYRAWKAVRQQVSSDGTRPVPLHLRNAPTRLMRELGHGDGYRHAHDEADAYAAGERYLPEGVSGAPWYQPSARGLEARIAERLTEWRRRDAEALAHPDAQRPAD